MSTKNITQAPVKNKANVEVVAATVDDARTWDSEIRPVLDSAHPGRTTFKWKSILRMQPRVKRVVFGSQATACYGLTLVTESGDGNEIIAGMALLVEGAVFPPDNKPCVYVWFLQSAPDAYILSKGGVLLPKSGEVLLDAAIVASMNAGFDGRILLHADPSGGGGLLEYYQKFGLASLPADARTHILLKKNDGRYFFADEEIARSILKRNKR